MALTRVSGAPTGSSNAVSVTRRSAARYRVMESHEDLESSGIWRQSRHGYIHLSFPSVSQYLIKTNFWTDQDVVRDPLSNRAPGGGQVAWETATREWAFLPTEDPLPSSGDLSLSQKKDPRATCG